MDTDRLLHVALDVAREAGQLLMSYYRSAYDAWDKSPDNPVTTADMEADSLLKARLMAETPQFGWLSEETVDSAQRLSKPWTWIVDPLDGTKEFIGGVDQFSVSIGLVHEGKPVLGVIYNPSTDQLMGGIVGQGLVHPLAEGQILSAREIAHGATVLVSNTEVTRGVWGPYETALSLKPTGSTAYKLGLVACGAGDAYITLRPKNEWDYCAGAALITAAGGKITDLDGIPLSFNRPKTLINGMVAANATLHRGLMAILQSAPSE